MADFRTAQLGLIFPLMARLDLTDDEREELVRALRQIIDGDRFPLSRRIRCMRQILDKLDLPSPSAEPFAAPSRRASPPHARRRRQ